MSHVILLTAVVLAVGTVLASVFRWRLTHPSEDGTPRRLATADYLLLLGITCFWWFGLAIVIAFTLWFWDLPARMMTHDEPGD